MYGDFQTLSTAQKEVVAGTIIRANRLQCTVEYLVPRMEEARVVVVFDTERNRLVSCIGYKTPIPRMRGAINRAEIGRAHV